MMILICDYHKIVCNGLKQILRQLSGVTQIEEAGNGDEALILLKKEVFDIVLPDISLPGKSGLEILQSVKTI